MVTIFKRILPAAGGLPALGRRFWRALPRKRRTASQVFGAFGSFSRSTPFPSTLLGRIAAECGFAINAGRRAARKGLPPRITRLGPARGALEGLVVQDREMSSSVDRRTGSRADRSRSPSLPRLRWPSEPGRKPEPETNGDRSAPADHAASKPPTPPRKAGSDQRAPAGRAAFEPPTRPATAGSDRGAPAGREA